MEFRLKETREKYNELMIELKNVWLEKGEYLRYSDNEKRKKIKFLVDKLKDVLKEWSEISWIDTWLFE